MRVNVGADGSIGGLGSRQTQERDCVRATGIACGRVEGVQDGTEVKLTYTLTANGSALMEEFKPKDGPVMITMFSVDGDHLIATHYCSARNQPQMATEPITEPKTKRLAFSLVRVTGMTTPDDWQNTLLAMVLEDITFAELAATLRVLLRSPRALGMHVTILDPELDPQRKHAAEFFAILVEAFHMRNST